MLFNRSGVRKSRMEVESALFPTDETKPNRIIDAGCVFGIALLAIILRYQYLSQIRSIPLFSNLIADSYAYDQWGVAIAGGDWLGKEVFYQAPLYPYFLGILYALFGHDLWSVRVVQMVMGALSCGLLYLVGKQFFSRSAGIAAGVILALYAPAIFYESLIQKSALDLFLVALLLLVVGYSLGKPGAI